MQRDAARNDTKKTSGEVSYVRSDLADAVCRGFNAPAAKRTHEEAGLHADDNEDESSSDEEFVLDQDCNQIRRRINNLIDSKEMMVREFCDKIRVSSKSYYDFMRQHGPYKGSQSSTYFGAARFFYKRQKKGIPDPKKRKTGTTTPAKAGGEANKSDKPGPKGSKKASSAPDLSAIYLEGQEDDEVSVYDTCDEIRRKIGAYLRRDGVTQAQFIRDLSSQYYAQSRKLNVSSLTAFRGKKGPVAGNVSPIFYAAYVFFEKLRIAERKPKSATRKEMEEIWEDDGGFDIKRDYSRPFICTAGSYPVVDKHGVFSMHRSR